MSAESSMSGRSSDKTRTQDFEKTTDGGFWNLNFEKEMNLTRRVASRRRRFTCAMW